MKRILCLLFCMLMLWGCSAVETPLPSEAPTPTPALSDEAPAVTAGVHEVEGALSAPTPKAATNVPSGVNGVFEDWASIMNFQPGSTQAKYYGMAIDGSREGNLVTIKQGRDGLYLRTRVTLKTAAGEEATLDILTERYFTEYILTLQSVDLDGDGTDELLLQYDFLASGGLQNTHVLTYKGGTLQMALAVLNPNRDNVYDEALLKQYEEETLYRPESFTGVSAVPHEAGYALETYQRIWDEATYSFNFTYNAFYYGGGAWRTAYPIEKPTVITGLDDAARLRTLVGGDARFTGGLRTYCQYAGYAANLDAKGSRDDLVYFHQAADAENTKLAVVEARLHVGGLVSTAFWRENIDGCYLGVGDIDGDGLSEIAVVLGTEGGVEIHVLKLANGALEEILTMESGVKSLSFAYTDTYLSAGVSFSWCNIGQLNGTDVLTLYQTDAEGGQTERYYGYRDGEWGLVE